MSLAYAISEKGKPKPRMVMRTSETRPMVTKYFGNVINLEVIVSE